MSPRRISINFDEFGKPLKDLTKSHEKEEVPKILTDIINYIRYFGKSTVYYYLLSLVKVNVKSTFVVNYIWL